MNKKQIYEYIKNKRIWYEITEHKAVYSMSEISEVEIPYPESDAKNLFVRDDKKENYYLITVRGNKRVNLKEFRKENNTRPLSFASEKELKEKEGTTQWLFLKWQYDNARKAFEKYNRRLEDLKDFIKLAKEELAKREEAAGHGRDNTNP